MKEITPSLSPWVGRIITCYICQRSYVIEVGDIHQAGSQSRHARSSSGFNMPCNHKFVTEGVKPEGLAKYLGQREN